jgi:RNA polymerase sigma-32 factor
LISQVLFAVHKNAGRDCWFFEVNEGLLQSQFRLNPMKKIPAKSKKSGQKKSGAQRSPRQAKAGAKKKTANGRSRVKKTSTQGRSTAKKTTKAGRSPIKKAAPAAKSAAKKKASSTGAIAEKTAKAAKKPIKRPLKRSTSTNQSAAKKAKRAAPKATRKTKLAATKTSTAAKKKISKRTRHSASPVKKTTESAKRVAKKATGKTGTAARKSATTSKRPVQTAAKTAKSRATKSVKSKKMSGQKAAKSAKALSPKGPAARSSDKALVKFDPLQRYLTEISTYKLLTREEERELGIRVREKGDKDAAYRLVTSNLRLVVKIALEFQRVWMQNLLDLIQEGNIGLMQAVKKFDPYKNVKFSYYASFWIKAYILKFIMDNWRLVKIGTTQGQRKLFFKLKKEKQKLIDEGFEPKPKLLSERLGVSEREIIDMDQRLDGWDVSLDAPLKEDSDTERIEFVSTEAESIEDKVSKKEIEVLLHNKIAEFRKKMTPRELEIFDLRIFSDNPVTLQEIGDRYGISRERVRQVEKNIIKKMREFFKREIPDFASYTEGSSAG